MAEILLIIHITFSPIIFILGVILLLSLRKQHKISVDEDVNWHISMAYSPEHSLSQLLHAMAWAFAGVFLLALNRDFGSLVEWQTINLFMAIIGIALAYYWKTLYLFVLSIVGLISWWGLQFGQWSTELSIQPIMVISGWVLIGISMYCIGQLLRLKNNWKRFGFILTLMSIILVIGILYMFSIKLGIKSFEKLTVGNAFYTDWHTLLGVIIIIILAFATLFYTLRKKAISIFEAIFLFLIVMLFTMFTFVGPQQTLIINSAYSYLYELNSLGSILAILFNILTFVSVLGVIFSGYIRRESWIINYGALLMFLFIILKYFDWFFDFLDKSLFFISAGLLMLFIGFFMEKGRRYMMSEIKKEIV